jgi:hypothetical protein
MTVNQFAPTSSDATAVSRSIGAIDSGEPGMVKSRKWNPKRMGSTLLRVLSSTAHEPTCSPEKQSST